MSKYIKPKAYVSLFSGIDVHCETNADIGDVVEISYTSGPITASVQQTINPNNESVFFGEDGLKTIVFSGLNFVANSVSGDIQFKVNSNISNIIKIKPPISPYRVELDSLSFLGKRLLIEGTTKDPRKGLAPPIGDYYPNVSSNVFVEISPYKSTNVLDKKTYTATSDGIGKFYIKTTDSFNFYTLYKIVIYVEKGTEKESYIENYFFVPATDRADNKYITFSENVYFGNSQHIYFGGATTADEPFKVIFEKIPEYIDDLPSNTVVEKREINVNSGFLNYGGMSDLKSWATQIPNDLENGLYMLSAKFNNSEQTYPDSQSKSIYLVKWNGFIKSPQNFIISKENNRLFLSWSESSRPQNITNGFNRIKYKVYKMLGSFPGQGDGEANGPIDPLVAETRKTNCILTIPFGENPSTNKYYVVAQDDCGNVSEPSDVVTIKEKGYVDLVINSSNTTLINGIKADAMGPIQPTPSGGRGWAYKNNYSLGETQVGNKKINWYFFNPSDPRYSGTKIKNLSSVFFVSSSQTPSALPPSKIPFIVVYTKPDVNSGGNWYKSAIVMVPSLSQFPVSPNKHLIYCFNKPSLSVFDQDYTLLNSPDTMLLQLNNSNSKRFNPTQQQINSVEEIMEEEILSITLHTDSSASPNTYDVNVLRFGFETTSTNGDRLTNIHLYY